MKNELEIKHTGENVQELIIREGTALPLKELIILTIISTITGIFLWLEKRVSEIKQKACHILVDKDKLQMTLVIDELNHYRQTIISKLELSKEYIAFGINSDKEWECFELSDFIKMNRTYFQDKVAAGRLITDLRNFKAKVSGELEKFKDDRANFELRRKQTVDSNLPADIKIKIPVFKGLPPINLTLEVCINPSDYACSFICPDATDYINGLTESIIEEQLDKIRSIAPDIAIIYQ